MITEDDATRPRPILEIGQPLDLLSVAELNERIAALKDEIARLERARDARQAATAAAEAFFKK